VPPVFAAVPGIPNNPDLYAKAHPDRVKRFPSSEEEFIVNPKLVGDNESHGGWRHELEHDTESVFWLLLYWAMVVQPEKRPKEKLDAGSWSGLNGNHEFRQQLLDSLNRTMSASLTHSFYKPLQPLIKELAAILVIDSHWLPASDPRKDRFYITEAFQRLILKFIIDNHGKEFMDHPVEKTFRKVQGIEASDGWSSTFLQSLDAVTREDVIMVGCVCGSMNSCPFLLLCLQGTDDVEMMIFNGKGL